jgi:hypothetical protein
VSSWADLTRDIIRRHRPLIEAALAASPPAQRLTGDSDDLMQRLATEDDPRFADVAGRAYIRIRSLQAALAAAAPPAQTATLRKAAQRLSDAITDKAAIVGTGRGWQREMDADAEYLASVKALRAALAAEGPPAPPKRKRIDWSNVVVDEGDEAP